MGAVKGLGFSLPEALEEDPGPESASHQRDLWRTWNWHPVLMTLAFSCLFSEALLVFRVLPEMGWRARKFLHAGLQLGALCFSTVGMAVVVQFKTAYHQEHMYSVHSWFGGAAYGAFALQFTIGAMFLLRPRWFVKFFPAHESYVRSVLPWHIMAGQSIYFCATLALVTGALDRETLFELYDGVTAMHDARFVLANLLAFAVAAVSYAVFIVHARGSGAGDHSGDDYYRAM